LTESVTDTQTHAHRHTQVNLYSVHAAYVVMRCLSVCLSVCVYVSVTFVDCVKTNKDVFEIQVG